MSLQPGTDPGTSHRADDGPAGERVGQEPASGTTQHPAGDGASLGEAADGVRDGPQEPSVGQPPATGDVAVDEALQDLPGLLDQPLEAQVEGYTAVHGRLQDRLADLDG